MRGNSPSFDSFNNLRKMWDNNFFLLPRTVY